MSRIWSEPYNSRRHLRPMPESMGWKTGVDRYFRNPTLEPHRVVLARVCGFTFTFHTAAEIARAWNITDGRSIPPGAPELRPMQCEAATWYGGGPHNPCTGAYTLIFGMKTNE